jgi:predicted ATP-dependent serine protease
LQEEIPEESAPVRVISSTELAGMQFETIGLQGKYRELIGDPSVGFTAMVYGLPKSGKSTLCIDFARHLAEQHGKVLYVAIEEGFGYTLKEKFERLKAIHPNLVIAEMLPDDLSQFQFIIIDSVSKAGLSTDDLTSLRKQYPKISFIYIFHTTKVGNFRGKQGFAHDVDVIIEVKNGVARGNGRFGVEGDLTLC